MLRLVQRMSKALLKYRNCFVAGVFAAGGSFFGRLPSQLQAVKLPQLLLPEALANAEFLYYFEFLLLHALPFALMVLCNVLNWRFFMKALHGADQTLIVTVLASATTFMISHILGIFIYQEPFRLASIVGTCFIVAGLWQLCDPLEGPETNEKEK